MNRDKMLPSLFISHGAPDILLSEPEAAKALRDIAARLPEPRAILVVSAHWVDDPIGVTSGGDLETLHDFGGFPSRLYELEYPAKGDEDLSADILHQLQGSGLKGQLVGERGLDHGAWIPLMLMYPEARIPVAQVALPQGSLESLVQLGSALRPLRDRGVLVLGSGGSVHNLRAMRHDQVTDNWAVEFEQWLLETVEGNRIDQLLTPTEFPRSFRQAHPTLEHYAPLIVAWAAADVRLPGRRIHQSFTYGNLGMSAYEFGDEPDNRLD